MTDAPHLLLKEAGNFMKCELHYGGPDELPVLLGMIALPAYDASFAVREAFLALMKQALSAAAETHIGKAIDWNSVDNNRRSDRS